MGKVSLLKDVFIVAFFRITPKLKSTRCPPELDKMPHTSGPSAFTFSYLNIIYEQNRIIS